MNKVLISLFLGLYAFPAKAAFIGPGTDKVTAQEVLSLVDGAYVTLEGALVERVKDELYIFEDSSGIVLVEVEEDDFRGLTITPHHKIRIVGEVDEPFIGNNRVDVDRLILLDDREF